MHQESKWRTIFWKLLNRFLCQKNHRNNVNQIQCGFLRQVCSKPFLVLNLYPEASSAAHLQNVILGCTPLPSFYSDNAIEGIMQQQMKSLGHDKAVAIYDVYIDEEGIVEYDGEVYLLQGSSRSNFLAAWAVTICIICTAVNCLIALQLPEFAPSLLEPVFSVTREQYRIFRQIIISLTPNHGDVTEPVYGVLSGTVISYPLAVTQTDLATDRYTVNESSLSGGMLHINRTVSLSVTLSTVD